MAEDHGLLSHIADLHRKHSELAIQLHDMRSASSDGASAHTEQLARLEECVKELTAAIKELIPVMKQDVEADRAVARGRTKQQ